ncbi:hypothetical protein GCM10011508_07690 [Flavobacterium lutivivi]|nr:hypothetical protein GCM10011508_07690 [Flavobacterium lutivivi]
MKFNKIIVFLVFWSSVVHGQIFTNPITGTNPNTANPYTAGQTVDPNITVSGIGRGSGIAGSNANNRYNANGWSTSTIDLTDYFEFTLTPAAGYKIDFTNFVYTSQVSSGTPSHSFRSSVDGFTSDIGTPSTTGTTISLSGASYQNITSSITFRFYTYGVPLATTTFSINDFTFNGSVTTTCTAPTTQATSFSSSSVSNFSGTVNWVRGNGTAGVIVVARQGSAVNADPASGTSYTANAIFGSGSQIGTGNYVVYNGTGTSVNVTGLLENTTYHFAVYEYNTTSTCYHLTELTGNFTTPQCSPTTQATTFTSSSVTGTSGTANWVRGNGNSVLVVARAGSAVNADPVSGTSYTANAVFGSGSQIGTGNFVVYSGTATSVNVTGLSASTTYHFAVYEFNTALNCYHLTELVGNFTTLALTPNIVLSDLGTQVTAAFVAQGTTSHILHKFQLAVTVNSATFTNLAVVTAGTYVAADVSNLKLVYSADNILDGADTTISTIAAPGATGTKVFPVFSQAIANGATGYFFITIDVSASAVIGNTIRINPITNTSLGFTSGTKSGNTSIGGYQTFSASPPNVPGALTRGCISNTSVVLNWSAPSGSFDGYILVARQGASPNAVTTINATTQPFNTDYSLAPTYNATTSRVLYIGNAITATITGLTAGLPYTFELYAYRNSGSFTVYSTTSRTTTQTMALSNVSAPSSSPGNTTGSINWVNPTAGCYDEIMAVITSAAGVTFVPSGDGTAYTANSAFSGFDQVVYKGTGNFVNITGLTNGVTYYIEIFVRKGTEWSSGVEVSVTPINVVPTVLKTGDLILIAYNNNASGGDDNIRLLTLVDINPGTKFLWTNATYETGGAPASNIRTDKWFECRYDVAPTGNVPFIEFTYSGSTVIPAASVFCIVTDNGGTADTSISAISPAGVSFTNFSIQGRRADGTTLASHTFVNVSTSDPDSMFLMQGYFNYDPAGSAFVGTVLSGVQDGGLWYNLSDDLTSLSSPLTANLRRSRKHPALECASLQANTSPGTYARSYNVSSSTYTTGNRPYLIGSILNYTTNWVTSYGTCPSPSPFVITASDPFNKWTGTSDTNWFNCNNWALLSVPDEFTDVQIDATATNDCNVSYLAANSDLYLDIAQCKDLTINGRKVMLNGSSNNKIEVYGNLTIGASGALETSDNTSGTPDGQIYLYGNWTNNASTGETAYKQGDGTVQFKGSTNQVINNVSPYGTEVFYNVVLDNNFLTSVSNDLIAEGNLTINSGKTVNIDSAGFIVAGKSLNHSGDLTIENNGQFVQIDETDANSGTYTGTKFEVKRDALAKNYDYIYWSSPTENFPVASLPNAYRFEWSTLYSNTNGSQGNWIAPSTTNMSKGKGYIAMANNGSSTAQTLPMSFTGKPFNGQFTFPIERGTYNGIDIDLEPGNPNNALTTKYDDNWNLVGNPYPSAIDAEEFLVLNQTKIEGSIWIWKHGLAPNVLADPFYQDFVVNYSSNDYIKYNGLGSTEPDTFAGKIASGQGFMVNMLETASTPNTITFNNDLRKGTNYTLYNNSDFYRLSAPQALGSNEEKNRIWLDIINEASGQMDRTLVGYSTYSTLERDHFYDCPFVPRSEVALFSLINNDNFIIQGRPLPFDNEDIVPMGINIVAEGNHIIAIKKVDGIFSGEQNIYLEDKYLNIIYDLKQHPYNFTSPKGVFKDRFVLRYTTNSLGNPSFETEANNVIVYSSNNILSVKSLEKNIKSIEVFDVLGRILLNENNIDSLSYNSSSIFNVGQTLVLKIKLDNGNTIVKKTIIR